MFDCAACRAKDSELKHLRALVDRILIGKGLQPVDTTAAGQEPAEMDIKDTVEKIDDIKTFGGE